MIGEDDSAFGLTINIASASPGQMVMRTEWKSLIITERHGMSILRTGTPDWRIHPGEILKDEFLGPMKISVYQLAKELHVPAPRINDVVLRRRGITADTAVRLARFFGTSEQFWLALQAAYEVSVVRAKHWKEIHQVRPLKAQPAIRS